MTPAPTSALGALLGLVVATGVLVSVSRVPAFRRPTLEDRVGPYLRDTHSPLRLALLTRTPLSPFPTLERLLEPYVASTADLLDRILGGSSSVRRRLEQAGSTISVRAFRVEQLVWGAVALGASIVIGLLLISNGTVQSPLALVVLCVLASIGGVLARDQRLTRQVRDREARMMAEFPTIADLLALSVAAGEGAVGALERVARVSHGELSRELRRTLAEARTGASLVVALEGVAERTSLPALSRFVDGVAVAVERGTPLADVLRAQAADVREVGKRALLEAGGRKEIAMMVPVVFFVLPVTVLFALFPGFVNLTLAVP